VAQAHQAFAIRFYALPAARALYYRFVRAVASRTNSFSGVRYANDPTIFAWELANEPRPLGQVEAYRAWIDEAAAVVRASLPRHMVALGSEGPTPWPGYVRTSLLEDHKAVDYVAIHVWPQNWLWYDPTQAAEPVAQGGGGGATTGAGKAEELGAGSRVGLEGGGGGQAASGAVAAGALRTLSSAIRLSAAYVDVAARAAGALGKPLVVEEFGLAREGASIDASSSTASRDYFYRWMCEHVAETAPAAGLNFWAWTGEGRRGQLMGDPPHEPQGW
jgi:mannan endo-1,4-beta-mannosidase